MIRTWDGQLRSIGENSDLVGKVGVIENANSPHNGEVVVVTATEGNTLTIKPLSLKAFSFAYAQLDRKDVRVL